MEERETECCQTEFQEDIIPEQLCLGHWSRSENLHVHICEWYSCSCSGFLFWEPALVNTEWMVREIGTSLRSCQMEIFILPPCPRLEFLTCMQEKSHGHISSQPWPQPCISARWLECKCSLVDWLLGLEHKRSQVRTQSIATVVKITSHN